MDYQVPQFIEVEDKIFGPFTLKQFIYVAGGIGLCAIFILYLPLLIGIILCVPVAAFAGALAFYRLNNKPFIEVLESGFNYYTNNRLYLWHKDKHENDQVVEAPKAPVEVRQKLGMTQGRLHELAWSLDVKDQQGPTT